MHSIGLTQIGLPVQAVSISAANLIRSFDSLPRQSHRVPGLKLVGSCRTIPFIDRIL
jgi:hypothetical protein